MVELMDATLKSVRLCLEIGSDSSKLYKVAVMGCHPSLTESLLCPPSNTLT